MTAQVWVVPYWSVVIPLDHVLRFFAPLLQPRKSNQKKTSPNPVSAEETPTACGEVFKGWRRKVGVVTLLIAAVFAARLDQESCP